MELGGFVALKNAIMKALSERDAIADICKDKPLRSLAGIRADILALEEETEGMIQEVLNG